MRYAVFATTEKGANLALRVREFLDGEVVVLVRRGKLVSDQIVEYDKLSEAVAVAFHKYDGLIFVMATGIVVRSIAPHLVNKLEDPAVVVMDENAEHVISLLSGHMGGANRLTKQLAICLASDAVITTATDVNNLQAPDALAAELGFKIYPKHSIGVLNSAILEGKKVECLIDKDMALAELYRRRLMNKGVECNLVDVEDINEGDCLCTLITDKDLPAREGLLYLKPRKLIAGMGCRRGASTELLHNALEMACNAIGREVAEVEMIASTVAKSDEAGLLSLAHKLDKKIVFFENEDLQLQVDRYGLSISKFVRENIGVGNVSEAAALCCVDRGQILLSKMKFGKATVALVWEK